MKLSEITDKEHFKKMLEDPKMAKVEKRLEELIPVFKKKGWALTYETERKTFIDTGPRIIVRFNLRYEDLGPGKYQNLDPDSNRHAMNKLFPDIHMASAISRQESRITIHMWPHHNMQEGL